MSRTSVAFLSFHAHRRACHPTPGVSPRYAHNRETMTSLESNLGYYMNPHHSTSVDDRLEFCGGFGYIGVVKS